MPGDAAKRTVVLTGRRVKLIGEFDLDALDVLNRWLPAGVASGLVVDLSECSFLDASVIAFLVGRAQAVGGDPQRFLLVGAGGQAGRILELTGLAGADWVGGHDELSTRRRRRGPPAAAVEKAAAHQAT